MATVALLVDFRLQPGSRGSFLSVMLDHAGKTRTEEPGCLQFDVLLDDDDEHRVILVEMYVDQEAYTAHRATARMAEVNAALAPLTVERKRTLCTLA